MKEFVQEAGEWVLSGSTHEVAMVRKSATRRAAIGVAVGSAVEQLEERTLFAVFTVTSAADSGPGTLRQAILDANAAAGADTVAFAVGGGGAVSIAPLS